MDSREETRPSEPNSSGAEPDALEGVVEELEEALNDLRQENAALREEVASCRVHELRGRRNADFLMEYFQTRLRQDGG